MNRSESEIDHFTRARRAFAHLDGISPFERIRRTNAAGAEYWSSRDFAQDHGYSDYRNFGQVILKARTACFNSGQRIEDHFVEITEMVKTESYLKPPAQSMKGWNPRDANHQRP